MRREDAYLPGWFSLAPSTTILDLASLCASLSSSLLEYRSRACSFDDRYHRVEDVGFIGFHYVPTHYHLVYDKVCLLNVEHNLHQLIHHASATIGHEGILTSNSHYKIENI